MEYLNEIRLKAVMEDLKNSDFKIAVIAEKNGFHNFEYFSRFFKKATGLSPVKEAEKQMKLLNRDEMAAELEDKVVSVDFVWSPAGDSDPFRDILYVSDTEAYSGQ